MEMSAITRRILAIVATWYGLGALFTSVIVQAGTGGTGTVVACLGLAVSALAATIGLWQSSAWAPKAVFIFGLFGAVFPLVLVAWVARAATADAWIAACIGGALFLCFWMFVAKGAERAARPAL